MLRGFTLVLALAGPAMAQPRTQQDILAVHHVCITKATYAANATLDDPDRPVDLAEALRNYRTLLSTVYDRCMVENGYKLRIGSEWCRVDGYFKEAFGCYELTH